MLEDSVPPRLQSGASVRPLNFTVRRLGHVISSLGGAVRLNWAWFLRVWQKAEEGCATGLRPYPDNLPVFRFQHCSARHAGSRAYRYSILCPTVTVRLTIVGGSRDAPVVRRRGR